MTVRIWLVVHHLFCISGISFPVFLSYAPFANIYSTFVTIPIKTTFASLFLESSAPLLSVTLGFQSILSNPNMWFISGPFNYFYNIYAPLGPSSSIDVILVFIAYALGEASNPPRCLIDIINNYRHHYPASKHTFLWIFGIFPFPVKLAVGLISPLFHIYMFSFIALRIISTHFVFRFILPYAATYWLVNASFMVVLLSAMAVLVMLTGANDFNDNENRKEETHAKQD
jgi:hypothetical protein